MKIRSGRPKKWKIAAAESALANGDAATALSHLARSCFGAAYDTGHLELLGRALAMDGQTENAGRFFFVSGARNPEYLAAIALFLHRHHNPTSHYRLLSQLPMRMRSISHIDHFPSAVSKELRLLGWPDCIARPVNDA